MVGIGIGVQLLQMGGLKKNYISTNEKVRNDTTFVT